MSEKRLAREQRGRREPRPSDATTYTAPRGPEGTRRRGILTMLGLAGDTQLISLDGPPTNICLTPSAAFIRGISQGVGGRRRAPRQLYNNTRSPHKSLNLQVVVFL